MTRNTVTWALAGLMIGMVLSLAEAFVLVTQARAMFFHTAELARTVAWTVGILAAVGAIGFAIIGAAVHGLHRVVKGTKLESHPLRILAIVMALAFIPVWWMFWQLTTGPQASQVAGRMFIVTVAALIVAAIISMALVRVPLWARESPIRKRVVVVGSLLVSIGFYIIDLTVLVRLYPLFHMVLTFGAFTVGGIGIGIWLDQPKTPMRFRIVLGIVVGVFAFGCWSFYATRGTQNPRFVMTEKTAVAADILALSYTLLQPQDTLAPESPSAEHQVQKSPSGVAITRPGANLFLITIDAMRFDRLKLLGANRPVAPNIDSLAERSIVFEKAYTPIPHTSYAISSLLTGKFTHPLFDIPGAPRVHETWPEILSRFRYKTAAFFTKAIFFIDRARFEPYIRSSYGFSYRKVDYLVSAEERVNQVLEYLKEERTERHPSPLFIWTHFFDPHEPYDSNCTRFGNNPEDRYDCEIWMVDRAVGRLIDFLDKTYPDSIVILTSDHGEEFEEHGGRFHGTTLYDEQARVPLLIRIPGLSHRIVKDPVSLVDLLGTSLSILDIPVPARVRSRNLSGLMVGLETEEATFAEVHEKAMIARGDHKLICDLSSSLCQLYDLVSDPQEKRSVAALEPELESLLKAKLGTWRKSHARFELRPINTGAGFAKWPQAIQKALGGDENAVGELFSLVKQNTEPVVRRKAAGLLYALWNERHPIGDFEAVAAETDPQVKTWLNLLRFKADRADTVDVLASLQDDLPLLSNVWRQAAFTRFSAGDHSAFDAILQIAMEDSIPTEDRQRAIRLIGTHGNRSVVPKLISLINNYQLTLEIATALGRIKDRRAVKPLSKRLRRERFSERKSTIILALANIGDKRAMMPIAGELFLDEPPAGILFALDRMRGASARVSITPLAENGKKAVIYSTFTKTLPIKKMDRVDRVVARTTAEGDGGSVIILCNGRESGRVPLFAGQQEIYGDIRQCVGKGKSPPELGLKIEPEGLNASVETVVFIGE
ncbi:MAG: sulfatase-like hydrolase/transferase [Proteobacteria bacterium]|nr:sulfatase-like hydrolase/transferase [Pseudomonadota bacterium]